MSKQIDIIQTEFTKQSSKFNMYMSSGDKEQFNNNAVKQMHLSGEENVLEVAAGTCAFGRLIAPQVAHMTELDATEAMLSIGKMENDKVGIVNAEYVIATAEKLPFSDGVFDAVVSRLAFHHFTEPKTVFAEMCRVLKTSGQLVISDMIARDEPYRMVADYYETLRDPSHICCLTIDELYTLVHQFNMEVKHCSITSIPMNLESWMDLTNIQSDIKEQIIRAMQLDINGGKKTGFKPYMKNNEIMFDHQWVLMICKNKK